MQCAYYMLWHPQKIPNLRVRILIRSIFVLTDLHPVVEMTNRGMCHSSDAASYNAGKVGVVCLLVWSRDRGLLSQKQSW